MWKMFKNVKKCETSEEYHKLVKKSDKNWQISAKKWQSRETKMTKSNKLVEKSQVKKG